MALKQATVVNIEGFQYHQNRFVSFAAPAEKAYQMPRDNNTNIIIIIIIKISHDKGSIAAGIFRITSMLDETGMQLGYSSLTSDDCDWPIRHASRNLSSSGSSQMAIARQVVQHVEFACM